MANTSAHLLISILILNITAAENVTAQTSTKVYIPGDSIKMPAEGAVGSWREISLVNRPGNSPRYLAERGGRSVYNGAESPFGGTNAALLISVVSTIFLII